MSHNTDCGNENVFIAKVHKKLGDLSVPCTHGPKFHNNPDLDAVNYDEFFNANKKEINQDIVVLDNNTTLKGSSLPVLYNICKSKNIPVVACPHGNRDFESYKISKRIGILYDYSFVFGKKEFKHLHDRKNKNRLILGGIPSNDKLCKYNKSKEYILVITGLADPSHSSGQTSGMKVFTEKEFYELKLLEMAEKHNCRIIIKNKYKYRYPTSYLRDKLSNLPVSIIDHIDDDNELIAGSKFVISAPSTLSFKPIQIGIPTVVLNGYGMTGNFYDFAGFVKCNYKSVIDAIDKQNCIQTEFISSSIEGGLDFNSTDIYIDNITKLVRKVEHD